MALDLIEDQDFHLLKVVLVNIFGADMSTSIHIDNKKRHIST